MIKSYSILNSFFLSWLFLLPLVNNIFGLGYEETKVAFFYLGLIVITAFWLIGNLYHKFKATNKVIFWSLPFLVSLTITTFLGINPIQSLFGEAPYFQGLIFYLFLFLVSILVAEVKLPAKKIVISLEFAAVLVALLSLKDFILQSLSISIPNYAGRVVSSFGQPNLYAGFLLLTLPIFFKYDFKNLGKFFSILSIIVSGSRAALFLMLGYLLWVLMKRLNWLKIKTLLIVSLLIVGASIYSLYSSSGLFYQELTQIKDHQWLLDNSPEKRALIWPVIGELILQKPWLGYGLENLEQGFSGYTIDIKTQGTQNPAYFGIKNLVVTRSHNYLLDLLFFSGIIGLLSWLFLTYHLLRNTHNTIFRSCLILYLIWIQFQIQSVVHLTFFWLLVGLSFKRLD